MAVIKVSIVLINAAVKAARISPKTPGFVTNAATETKILFGSVSAAIMP